MCGIIGYVGQPARQGAAPRRARARSSTAATTRPGSRCVEDDGLEYVRAVGNLAEPEAPRPGRTARRRRTGLGHTRWATHGGVTEENAHPLTGCDDGELAIVLNGIVENYRELRPSSRTPATTFTLRDRRRGGRPSARGRRTTAISSRRSDGVYAQLEGHFTFVVIHRDEPDLLVGVRCETPLVVGLGEGENFLASNRRRPSSPRRAASSIPPGRRDRRDHARRVRDRSDAQDGVDVARDVDEIDWDEEVAETRGLRDVHAQGDLRAAGRPRARRSASGSRHGVLVLDGLGLTEDDMRDLRRIVIVACGTAYHAGRRRALRDRGVGAGPGRAGRRERVDLPQPGARRRHARDRRSPSRARRATRSRRCSSRARSARGSSRSRT